MSQMSIITDVNRCVGCLACSVACKAVNNVPIGNYWNKVVRIGPNPTPEESGQYPDVYMYFLPLSCQHCENPECVHVCPTEASCKAEDDTVQIDKEKCIGCQFCVMACPYGVATSNQGELPQCVSQCGGNARWVGDMEKGLESFVGSFDSAGEQRRMLDFIEDFDEADLYKLPDAGNKPSFAYILRGHTWEGGDN